MVVVLQIEWNSTFHFLKICKLIRLHIFPVRALNKEPDHGTKVGQSVCSGTHKLSSKLVVLPQLLLGALPCLPNKINSMFATNLHLSDMTSKWFEFTSTDDAARARRVAGRRMKETINLVAL